MTYRILLAMSGILMMFAVFSLVMLIGAYIDPLKANVSGITIMSMVTTIATLVVLRVGLAQRKRMHTRFDAAVSEQVRLHGYVDAEEFAAAAQISLDSAREVLDTMARHRGWKRTEHAGYNAHYVVGPSTNGQAHHA